MWLFVALILVIIINKFLNVAVEIAEVTKRMREYDKEKVEKGKIIIK